MTNCGCALYAFGNVWPQTAKEVSALEDLINNFQHPEECFSDPIIKLGHRPEGWQDET